MSDTENTYVAELVEQKWQKRWAGPLCQARGPGSLPYEGGRLEYENNCSLVKLLALARGATHGARRCLMAPHMVPHMAPHSASHAATCG